MPKPKAWCRLENSQMYVLCLNLDIQCLPLLVVSSGLRERWLRENEEVGAERCLGKARGEQCAARASVLRSCVLGCLSACRR